MEKLIELLMNSPLMGKKWVQAIIKIFFVFFVILAVIIIIGGILGWTWLNYENIEKISSIFTGAGLVISILLIIVLTKQGSDAFDFEKELVEIAKTGTWTVPKLFFAFIANHDGEFEKGELTEFFTNTLPKIKSVRGNKLDLSVFSNLTSKKDNPYGDEISFKKGRGPLIETKGGKIFLTKDGKEVAETLFPK